MPKKKPAAGTRSKKLIVWNSIDKTMPIVVRMAMVEAPSSPHSISVSTLLRARARGVTWRTPSAPPPIASSSASDAADQAEPILQSVRLDGDRDHVVLGVGGERHALGRQQRLQFGKGLRQIGERLGVELAQPVGEPFDQAERKAVVRRGFARPVLDESVDMAVDIDRRADRPDDDEERSRQGCEKERPPAVIVRPRMGLDRAVVLRGGALSSDEECDGADQR